MKINRKLNLVFPVEKADGSTVYLHSTPISMETFKQHFLLLSKTFSAIFSEGLAFTSGPRIAAMMLRANAESLGVWEGPTGAKLNLMAEIHRLTNVLVPSARGGWDTLMFEDALRGDYLDEDDSLEAENAICFFTLVSVMMRRNTVPEALARMCSLWATQTTFLSCTDFAHSLPTSTVAVSSGVTMTASSVPS